MPGKKWSSCNMNLQKDSCKKWKTCYKVVKRRCGLWLSCTVNVQNDSCCVYSINEITNRPINGGPLCVFETFKAADDFAKLYHADAIFECKYLKSNDNMIWPSCEKSKAHNFLPRGTKLADKVKLIKRVNRREMRKNKC